MAKNSDRFITAFNRIDKAIDMELENSRGIGFSKAVRILTKYNAVVRRYKDDLLEFAELRNAIVHNRLDTVQVIAEPHDSIVEQIEKIEDEITKPKLVIPQFEKKVHSFQLTDSLSDLLNAIDKQGYSKFPIYLGKEFKGLVTESGITKWLAKNKDASIITTSIEEIMPYQKEDNYQFVSRDTTVYHAIEAFKDRIGNGSRMDALLITNGGQLNEELLGIITVFDVMGYHELGHDKTKVKST
ncbi:CBS domain-containing protein [Ornithinibacillus scapharcae]|uniref:CBS domain-containing protein n=1 Tax=Ornithinibacillus scapharcae TaxID=1147159 RepID=UPI000225B017|nr:CBS domain-containing protein [Ornithinibacillus scapharcae]